MPSPLEVKARPWLGDCTGAGGAVVTGGAEVTGAVVTGGAEVTGGAAVIGGRVVMGGLVVGSGAVVTAWMTGPLVVVMGSGVSLSGRSRTRSKTSARQKTPAMTA